MSEASLLDDVAALEHGDSGGMLRAVASGAAQVREAAVLAADAELSRLAEDGRPRAVLLCGTGVGQLAGELLLAVAGLACPVPVVLHPGNGLPGWVGPLDLVVAVDPTGATPETLSAIEPAVRRGCRLLVLGPAGSPLAELGERGRAVQIATRPAPQPRAGLWSLVVPLLLASEALGLLRAPAEMLAATATALEDVAERCRVDAASLVNPAKRLALELDGVLPLLWGSTPLTGAAAHRFARQLHENAGAAALFAAMPELANSQLGVLDGPAGAAPPDDNFFRDRAGDTDAALPLAMVLLREPGEGASVARAADLTAALARERAVPVTELYAETGSPLVRLASLIGLTDFASTYLALLQGTDPTPVPAVQALAAATRRVLA